MNASSKPAMTKPHLFFVGVGNMGNPMAANLVKAGYEVSVFDRVTDKTNNLVQLGAKRVATLAEGAAQADVVMTSLPGPPQVKEVMLGEGGLISAMRPGATIIDTTTSAVDLVKELVSICQQRGIDFLEAPVTNAIDAAAEGRLSIFVGGDVAVFEKHRPLFDVLATKIFHVGAPGNGATIKLLTNLLWFVSAAAIGEGLMLGKRAGLDLPSLIEAIQSSYGGSFVCAADSPKILDGVYNTTFPIQHACKDMRLTTDMADAFGVPMELAKYVQGFMEGARAKYGDGADCLAVVKMLEEAARIPLRR